MASAPAVAVSCFSVGVVLGVPWAPLAILLAAGTLVVLATTWQLETAFGPANAVTTLRMFTVLLAMAALWPAPATTVIAWLPCVMLGLALALDGLDGFLARRLGTSTSFGARFDVNVDSLLLLGCVLHLFASGRSGGWVFAVPALRPLFLIGRRIAPRLGGTLPPSRLRKMLFASGAGLLVLALVPALPRSGAAGLAACSLLVLTVSFAFDTLRLLRRPKAGRATADRHLVRV
jgi:phosphatidylglycerophosphate synthase